jgi:hypothetical protein
MNRWQFEKENEDDRNAYLREKRKITRYRQQKRSQERI